MALRVGERSMEGLCDWAGVLPASVRVWSPAMEWTEPRSTCFCCARGSTQPPR
jgi:hypothetical protein